MVLTTKHLIYHLVIHNKLFVPIGATLCKSSVEVYQAAYMLNHMSSMVQINVFSVHIKRSAAGRPVENERWLS